MSIFEIRIRKRGAGDGWSVECSHKSNNGTNHYPNHYQGTFHIKNRDELDNLADAPRQSEEYGKLLGEALFKDSIRDGFITAVGKLSDGQNPLRVLLDIEDDDELKTLRWEKLCAPVEDRRWSFLRFDRRLTFSIDIPSPIDSLRFPSISKRDLRALVLVASPKHHQLHEFNVQNTVSSVKKALQVQEIDCDVLANLDNIEEHNAPTLTNLLKKLQENQEKPYTLLHIVCHGMVTRSKTDTMLYWAKADSQVEEVLGAKLIKGLKERGYRLPHFTFLCSCETASPEKRGALGGLAGRLVQELGMPAVIAMTDKVEVETARTVAEQFYKYLKESGEVDSALAKAVPAHHNIPDIIVPALFSRLGGLPLFSDSLDKELNNQDINRGLERLLEVNHKNEMPDDSEDEPENQTSDDSKCSRKVKHVSLIQKHAPILQEKCEAAKAQLEEILRIEESLLKTDAKKERDRAVEELNKLCQEVLSNQIAEFTFNALALGSPIPKYDARCPFQGLLSFDVRSKDFFFGRNELIKELEEKLKENNFLAVIGDSGSGKSSVVRAGLIPALLPGKELEQMAYLTPGKKPLQKLEAKLNKNSRPAVLVVDQFEELFTLSEKTQRKEFIDRLLKLISSKQRVVITMRVDFWGECANYGEGFRELIKKSQSFILRMTSDELRNAMERQAEKVGLRFEAGLSKLIWNEVEGEPGAMPLLQHALRELWKRRHGQWLLSDEYEKIGTKDTPGLKGAIAKTAEDFYNDEHNGEKLSDEDKEQVKNIFMCLTQVDKNAVQGEHRRDTRRRVTEEDLLKLNKNKENPNRIWQLVTLLANRRLVIITNKNTKTGQIEVEVAHEALIRYWPRLQEWLEENRNDLILRDKIREYAEDWQGQEDGKKENSLNLRGEQLEEAEKLLNNESISLGEPETKYIQACRDWHEQQMQEKLEANLDIGIKSSQLLFASNKRLDALLNLIKIERNWRNDLEKYEYSRLRFLVMFGYVFSELTEYNSINADEYDEVTSVSWNPVNQIIASASSTGVIKIWNEDGKFIDTIQEHNGKIFNLTFSPDGETLASAGEDGSIYIWRKEIKNDETIPPSYSLCNKFEEHRSEVRSISFSPDSQLIVSGCGDGSIKIWQQEEKKSRHTLENGSAVQCVTFSPDGKILASADAKKALKLWSCSDVVKPFDDAHTESITSIAFSPNNKILVSSSEDRWIKLWDNQSGDIISCWQEEEKILYVSFSPDGKLLASADVSGTIKLWARTNKHWSKEPKLFKTINPAKEVQHKIKLQKVSFSQDGQKLISCNGNNTIKFWNCFSKFDGYANEKFNGHSNVIESIDFNVADKTLATASEDGIVKIWDYDGSLLQSLTNNNGSYKEVRFSQNGKIIAVVNDKNSVIFWKKNVGSDYKEFYNYDEKVESISFNSVGNICAIAQNESIVILNLDDETNQVLQILTEHTELIKRVNFNSDGKMIVSVSKDGIVKLWKLDDNKLFQPFGKAVKVFEGDYVSFFDDDKIITANRASEANPSYEIKLWTLEGQLLKSIISKTKKFIFDLIFSQDHKTIISIAQDCIVEFWNLDNNSSKAIQLGSGYFSAVSFSPDWGVIAVASYESDYQTRIKLWNLNLTEALEEANRYIGDYQNQ